MRTKYALVNILTGWGSQLILALLGFLTRKIFLDIVGVGYLGINGLISNILSMLSLAESGIGGAIIYNLYKPLAEKDESKIMTLMRVYKKAYYAIGAIVAILGLMLLPFLKYITRNNTVSNVNIIFLLFLFNTVSSYFFSYKMSLLTADQKKYILIIVTTAFKIVITVIKIGVLIISKNYFLFLAIDIVTTLLQNILISELVNRIYPFIKSKNVLPLDRETKENIIKNIKALVLHNIGSFCVFGTDNIVISTFVSVAAVGLYSNYLLIIDTVKGFISQIFIGLTSSMGNLVAKEENDKKYYIFKIVMFGNFWISGFCAVCFLVLIEPFISLWIGRQYIMNKDVLYILVINFYVTGMRQSIGIVKDTSGIFHEDRYAPLLEAAINLIASVILVKILGISGVFIGTLISTLSVPFWVAPYFVYKLSFKQPLKKYFKSYFLYGILTFVAAIVTNFICYVFFNQYNISSFFGRVVICIVIPNLIFTLVFYRSKQLSYLLKIIQHFMIKVPIVRIMISKRTPASDL